MENTLLREEEMFSISKSSLVLGPDAALETAKKANKTQGSIKRPFSNRNHLPSVFFFILFPLVFLIGPIFKMQCSIRSQAL